MVLGVSCNSSIREAKISGSSFIDVLMAEYLTLGLSGDCITILGWCNPNTSINCDLNLKDDVAVKLMMSIELGIVN